MEVDKRLHAREESEGSIPSMFAKIESTDGVLRRSQLGSGVFVDSHVRVTTRDSCKCPVALNKLGPLMGSLDYTRRGK